MGKNRVRREYFYEIMDMEEELLPEVDRVGAFVDKMFAVLASWITLVLQLCAKSSVRRALRYVGVVACFFCFIGLALS
jgi:hypothetical protein